MFVGWHASSSWKVQQSSLSSSDYKGTSFFLYFFVTSLSFLLSWVANTQRNHWIKSVPQTNVLWAGLRQLPSGSPLWMSNVWCSEMPGWRTRSVILSNLALRCCYMLGCNNGIGGFHESWNLVIFRDLKLPDFSLHENWVPRHRRHAHTNWRRSEMGARAFCTLSQKFFGNQATVAMERNDWRDEPGWLPRGVGYLPRNQNRYQASSNSKTASIR